MKTRYSLSLSVMSAVVLLSAGSALAWSVDHSTDYKEYVQYYLKCNSGRQASIKHFKESGKWYVGGWNASNYAYKSMDAAAKAACQE